MQIANSLKGLTDDPQMRKIMDRKSSIDDVVAQVISDWSYDLYERRPAPAYRELGDFKGTDLDLATFMSALAERHAVINIPEYERRREKTHKESEWVVSPENRHGHVAGLTANKDVFSFSVKIKDQNVVNRRTGEVGAYRNFLLTDLDGSLYNGWNTIEFIASADENNFLKDRELWSGNSVYFKNFVHPNSWVSFYGAPGIKAKALEHRLTEEAGFYRNLAGILQNAGIRRKIDRTVPYESRVPDMVYREPGRKIRVDAFNSEVDFLMRGKFPTVRPNSDGLAYAQDRANQLTYSILPKIRFLTRATDLGFRNYGANGENKPSWNVPEWEHDYKTSTKARKLWNRMDLGNGVALRYRTFSKTETVN